MFSLYFPQGSVGGDFSAARWFEVWWAVDTVCLVFCAVVGLGQTGTGLHTG